MNMLRGFLLIAVMAVAGLAQLGCDVEAGLGSTDKTLVTGNWDAQISATQASGGIAESSGTTYGSSTKLEVTWASPQESFDHFEVVATDSVQDQRRQFQVDRALTSTTLTGLKSGTSYSIELYACTVDTCAVALKSAVSVTASTAEEVWQLQGSGNTYTTCSQIALDTTTAPFPVVYGPDAGTDANGVDLEGRVRLYVNSPDWSTLGKGVAVAEAAGLATADLSGVTWFDRDDNYGFLKLDTPTTLLKGPATVQGIPLADELGGAMRMIFEAQGADGRQRVLMLDSEDGLVGRDFLVGDGGVFATAEDYNAAGITVLIGVDGDPYDASSGLTQARQSKVGFPVLDNWRWDGAAGTFMIITGADSAGQTTNGLFMASFDGSAWTVAKDASGAAAPLVTGAHGPVIQHLGAQAYKLYFEDESASLDKTEKPLRLIYVDGASSGNSSVDFDEWEAAEAARDVHFLWPDGSELSASEESGLGDHAIYCPTFDLETQVMYMNLGGRDDDTPTVGSHGVGMAALVNP